MITTIRKCGQAATEYILVVCVLAVAAVAVTYQPLTDSIQKGTQKLSRKVGEGSDRGGYGMNGTSQR